MYYTIILFNNFIIYYYKSDCMDIKLLGRGLKVQIYFYTSCFLFINDFCTLNKNIIELIICTVNVAQQLCLLRSIRWQIYNK